METYGLENVKTFEQLLPWLADNLDWPVHEHDFEDLSYDWDPFSDLGIKAEDVAQLRELKQLRPLVTNQPWGIFFVSFEGSKIPLGVLKRILGAFTIKKRASAATSEKKTWELHDLLFISAQGKTGERELSFLHFNEETDGSGKIVLKELGWDQQDTQTKLTFIAGTLKGKLAWPEDDTEVEEWRRQWSAAFSSKHGAAISTAKDLTKRLADLAGKIRLSVKEVLDFETKNGPLTKIFNDFKLTLFHNLDHDGFADMYAQTICYGLLAANIMRRSGELVAEDAALIAPLTQPFLKDLMETFLAVGGKKNEIDFNALGIEEVVTALQDADMDAVLLDFGNKNPHEDPILHFYEHFLQDYDGLMRKGRGVYYTPQPVVSFIVRSVDEILQKEFGLTDGLADITTWGEMCEKKPDLKIPEHAEPVDPFVQILDPATGTGTFLVEVIDLVHTRMTQKWIDMGKKDPEIKSLWNQYVPRHLLPRLNGFELMMAPYAIAHIKIAMKLAETGYQPEEGELERVRVFLTNTLEEARYSKLTKGKTVDMFAQVGALEDEAVGADKLKTEIPITIVIGNPPYAGHSANLSKIKGKPTFIGKLLRPYFEINGQQLKESNTKWLNDDYVKFLRYSEWKLTECSVGILGMITNNGFLDNPTFRGMRESICNSFTSLRLIDLHGSVKKMDSLHSTEKDENVFEIQQGVSISLFYTSKKDGGIFKYDLFGHKSNKFDWLKLKSIFDIDWEKIILRKGDYLFQNFDHNIFDEYENFISTKIIFPDHSLGCLSKRDKLVIGFSFKELCSTIQGFLSKNKTDMEATSRFGLKLKDNDMWDASKARASVNIDDVKSFIEDVNYRPFDSRKIFMHDKFIARPNKRVLRNFQKNDNVALINVRQLATLPFSHTFVSSIKSEQCFISNRTKEGGTVFPLYILPHGAEMDARPNICKDFIHKLTSRVKLNFKSDTNFGLINVGGENQTEDYGPRDIFHYIYAVLNSSNYRLRYADFLKSDFPRIPLPEGANIFLELVELGRLLVDLHLLAETEAIQLQQPETRYIGTGEARVEKGYPKYENGKVMINPSCHFEEVTPDVWGFYIGSYQVCCKWLKDRAGKGGKNPHPGRVLTDDDIMHYRRITVAIKETMRLMAEVDKVINKHGGWPDAFYVAPPPPPTIEELIALDEGQEVEYKSTFQFCLKEKQKSKPLQKACLKTVAAFLNSGGGTLAIGVTNDKRIHGLEDDFGLISKDDKEEWFRQTIVNAINDTIGELYAPSYECRYAKAENDKLVFVVEIKERGPKPAYVNHLKENNEEFFVRTDLKTVRLTGEKRDEYIKVHWD
jgi:predicted helicase